MIKYLISLSFIFSGFSVFCQHYAALYSNKQALYVNTFWEGHDGNLVGESYLGISIDSVKIKGLDTICYHFNILRSNSETMDCNYFKKVPNWTGSKTIITNDGEN